MCVCVCVCGTVDVESIRNMNVRGLHNLFDDDDDDDDDTILLESFSLYELVLCQERNG